jgi:hypothetical protein
MMIELLASSLSHTRFPVEGLLELAASIDEGSVDGPLTLANGASGVSIPGIGSGATDITTLSVFAIFAFGVVTLVWNGGSATTLNGSTTNPAIFLVGRTANTSTPTVSNSSGAAVEIFVVKAGA